MLDGKEFSKGQFIPERNPGFTTAVESLLIHPGYNRLRYTLTIPKPKELKGRAEHYRGSQLVVEGDMNPLLETLHDLPISFSRDGRHYAYYARFPPPPNGWEYTTHLVVDGKVDPPRITRRRDLALTPIRKDNGFPSSRATQST